MFSTSTRGILAHAPVDFHTPYFSTQSVGYEELDENEVNL